MSKRGRVSPTSQDALYEQIQDRLEKVIETQDKLVDVSPFSAGQVSDLGDKELDDLEERAEQARMVTVEAKEVLKVHTRAVEQLLDAADELTESLYASHKLAVGDEVAFYMSKEQCWIRCRITRMLDRKIEVQDTEPDESGQPGKKYKTTLTEVRYIPPEDTLLVRAFKPGTIVISQYPQTTAFYPATVVKTGEGFCDVQFEDEDDADKITRVPRHLVLPVD